MLQRRQSDPDQLLRDMRDDLRFLSCKAGRTPPLILKILLANMLLFFALCFVVEIYVVFFGSPNHRISKTAHEPVHLSKENPK
jgi:hypothetical protein